MLRPHTAAELRMPTPPAPPPVADEDDPRALRAVAAAIERLARDWQAPPGLDQLAAEAGLSPWHFQRLFKRAAGISPKRFAQFVTLGHARRLLRQDGTDLLGASLDLGLSGPSRLHDLFVVAEAATPGEYKAAGAGLEIRWGMHQTGLGRALLAATPRGICWLSFLTEAEPGPERHLAELALDWPKARLLEDPGATAAVAARAFLPGGDGQGPVTLHLKGTNFQMKVWQALLTIPFGQVATYAEIGRRIGSPTAARAVGNAVGANPVSFLIPCHRVIRGTGVLDNYRWGPARKRVLLAWEAARLEEPA
ncbi:methylated-DNA--[protein]-cysteine S-methyltransferase [Oleisolibacter albus]|uniref:methylated-DNA--[protein]-cysteine S-methyltransferase n=1 Tax=Oleisolibacter albus TaxID=2171757 RepID=UPI000DF4AAE6|nr:methylated-DNA--[protein]-cysteine S-methyltransferase [Oleisolibacter albus]